MFGEVTWPEVGMEFVKFLGYMVGTCAALYLHYRQLKPEIVETKKDVSRAVEMNEANGVKLNRVETGLQENTAVTQTIAKAVNGGLSCGYVEPAKSISSQMSVMQTAMVAEMAKLKQELAELRKAQP